MEIISTKIWKKWGSKYSVEFRNSKKVIEVYCCQYIVKQVYIDM